MSASPPPQLGFDGLLAEADDANRKHRFARDTFHLPETMAEGLPYYRDLIEQHHGAMVAADVETVIAIREEARRLARKLNGGSGGYLAGDDSPGNVLTRETAAPSGTIPFWGQSGSFEIVCQGVRVRIELEGLFGIGTGFGFWPGFSAHAVEPDKPFLSSTGYRSFLGLHGAPEPGLAPQDFVAAVIAASVEKELKGRLVSIEPAYRKRIDA
jgi:hypothetical protein